MTRMISYLSSEVVYELAGVAEIGLELHECDVLICDLALCDLLAVVDGRQGTLDGAQDGTLLAGLEGKRRIFKESLHSNMQ